MWLWSHSVCVLQILSHKFSTPAEVVENDKKNVSVVSRSGVLPNMLVFLLLFLEERFFVHPFNGEGQDDKIDLFTVSPPRLSATCRRSNCFTLWMQCP